MKNTNFSNETSKRLKELRLQHGYTMESLGEKIGVVKSTIAKWENGYVDNIKRDMIVKLAELYNVSPIYIMGYDIEPTDLGTQKERTERFTQLYNRLDDSQRQLVENMITALLKKK